MFNIVLPVEYCLPKDVYFQYFSGKEKHTRIVEYKKLTKYKSNHTLIGIEKPSLNQKFIHYLFLINRNLQKNITMNFQIIFTQLVEMVLIDMVLILMTV